MMKNSGIPNGGARLNSSSSGGVAVLLNSGIKGTFLETLYSGMGRWIISVVHFERIKLYNG